VALSKRQLILQAAVENFSVKGYHNTKIEDIAQQAKVGKGTVYEYFKSKQHLFQELIKEGYELYMGLIEQETKEADETRRKLEKLIGLNFKYCQRYRFLVRIAMLENIAVVDSSFHDWMIAAHKTLLQQIEDILRDGIARNEIRPVETAVLARMLYGSMGMLANPFLESEQAEEELDLLACRVVDYFFRGISAEN
jgi:AcrR family transcriptional regulator